MRSRQAARSQLRIATILRGVTTENQWGTRVVSFPRCHSRRESAKGEQLFVGNIRLESSATFFSFVVVKSNQQTLNNDQTSHYP